MCNNLNQGEKRELFFVIKNFIFLRSTLFHLIFQNYSDSIQIKRVRRNKKEIQYTSLVFLKIHNNI
jgi:hypothetical protein